MHEIARHDRTAAAPLVSLALEKSLQSWGGLLERLPVGVYTCDHDGVLVHYNRRAAELWGRSPAAGDPEHRFCGALRAYRPDGTPLPLAEAPMAEVLRTGEPVRDREVVVERPDGSRITILANLDPLLGPDGGIVGGVNCFQDITDRKLAEQRSREDHGLLRTVVETTPECVKIVARDGTLLRMNRAGLRMIGAAEAEAAQGCPVLDLIAPEHRELWRANHERVCRGESLSWEFDIVGLHGTRRHMETHAAPLRMPDGTTAQLAVTRDVTQRKRHEEALRERERHARELLEALPAAVYTTDAEGRITFYNGAAVGLWGCRPELGSDRWCGSWRLFRPDGAPMPHEECPMAVALKEGRPVRGAEAIAERPDGTRVPFIPYPTPLRDDAGTLVGAVNMLVDITERKRAEEQQELLLAELSHRVKNTLATVQAIARQTLLRVKDPAAFVPSFGGRLQALACAHTLLTQSSWRGADLAALVREQLLLDASADGRIVCAGPGVVLGPEVALHLALVLHELGTNARKHGALSVPEGRLSIGWAVETAGARVLRLRWIETGGPPVSASSAPGFGTVLIERSLKAHGGETRMLSEATGVSWEIELPLPRPSPDVLDPRSSARAPAGAKARKVRQDGRDAEERADVAGRRVLVVEDEPVLALDIASSLAEAGIAVVGPAGTVEEAARLIETARLDGAVLDANLGGDPVDEIAAALTRRNVPFAFVTGYGRESLPRAFQGTAIVAKPFSSGELVEAARRLLSRGDADVVPMRGPATAA